MLTPDDPQHRETPSPQADDPATEGDRAFAERIATKKLLDVWSRPEGPFPLVTLLVVFASVVASGFAYLYPEPTYQLLYANGGEIWVARKWWGLLGCVFIHGGIMHLVFNCYWIWLLGRLLERELGSIRFLCLFLGTAAFSSIAELAWAGQPGVGLSGVAYAFFGFLLVNPSRHPDFRRVLSGNTRLLLGGWLVACFVLTYTKVLNVANFAHLGGFVAGWISGAAAYPRAWRNRARAACVVLGIAALSVVFWAPWQKAWQVGHAYRALVAHDKETALVALEKVRAKDPENTWALIQEVALRNERGEYALARDLLNQSLKRQADTAILNYLAWILATCPAPEIRDGGKATDLALRACELDEWKTSGFIDTLAVAYAETGNFTEAEKWVLKALETPGPHTAVLQTHLDAFRAKKPWREQPSAAK